MNERIESASISPHSPSVWVGEIQAPSKEVEQLEERMAYTADYARTVAGTGSWRHEEVESWEEGAPDLVGTQFLPIYGGGSVALRPKVRNSAQGRAYLELLLKAEEGEPKILAVIEGSSIELSKAGKPEFSVITAILGLLEYIDAHEAK